MTYKFDPAKENPLIEVKVNGKEVSDDKNYSIATNNYVTSQFLKFFGTVSQEVEIKDTGMIDRDVIIDAVEKQNVINSVKEDRIVDLSKNK